MLAEKCARACVLKINTSARGSGRTCSLPAQAAHVLTPFAIYLLARLQSTLARKWQLQLAPEVGHFAPLLRVRGEKESGAQVSHSWRVLGAHPAST